MKQIELALSIAFKVHSGQTDRGGEPYILHPLHVMSQMDSDLERVVAVLHDVIEDGDMISDDLVDAGIEKAAVDIVSILTRVDGESYEEYIRFIASNAVATKVKLADLKHNMDLSRLERIDDKAIERFNRYAGAFRRLVGGADEKSGD